MGDRLTLEQRRVVASLMEVYGSPTIVRQKFAEQFAGRDPQSRFNDFSCIPHEMCVRALTGTVACWLLCVKHNGKQVETVL
jgi:hypothetical protein